MDEMYRLSYDFILVGAFVHSGLLIFPHTICMLHRAIGEMNALTMTPVQIQ